MLSSCEHFSWGLPQRNAKTQHRDNTRTEGRRKKRKKVLHQHSIEQNLPFPKWELSWKSRIKVKDRLRHAACWSNASVRTDGILKQSICDHSIIKIKVAYSPAEVLPAACQLMSRFLALLFHNLISFCCSFFFFSTYLNLIIFFFHC